MIYIRKKHYNETNQWYEKSYLWQYGETNPEAADALCRQAIGRSSENEDSETKIMVKYVSISY